MSPPRLLFVSLTNDGGADRIVAAFGGLGARCAVLGPVDAYCMASRHAHVRFPLPRLAFASRRPRALARRLEAIVATFAPDIAIPVDEMAATLVRACADVRGLRAEVAALLRRSFGDPAGYPAACNRSLLLEAAEAAGVDVVAFRPVSGLQDALRAAETLGYPLVLKRENTAGGGGVTIVGDRVHLASALRKASLVAKVKRATGRLTGRRATGPSLLVQAFATGRLAMRTVACRNGVVLAGHSLMAEAIDPPGVGSSTMVRPILEAILDRAAERLVASLGCSGFVSFDFIIGDDGSAGLIEMNARPTASGHLSGLFGPDIYRALYADLGGVAAEPASPTRAPCTVALFPKELGRDPSGAGLARPGVLHDVPLEDPALVETYCRHLEHRFPERAGMIRLRIGGRPSESGRASIATRSPSTSALTPGSQARI